MVILRFILPIMTFIYKHPDEMHFIALLKLIKIKEMMKYLHNMQISQLTDNCMFHMFNDELKD